MEPSELTPAEFEGAPRNRYRPGFPWRRIGFVVLAVALVVGIYFWRQKVRADALRERIYTLHSAEVVPVLEQLEATWADLLEKTLSAKSGAATRLVEAKVPLSELHDERVAYLKVRAPELRDEETLLSAIAAEEEDAVGACLGLSLTPVSAFSDVPEVLSSKWLARSDETNDMQRLSVREEQLARAIDRELPGLKERLPADYFLLVLVQGKSRLEDPVDVFLWDLHQDKLVLRSRTENRGKLITVRSQIGAKPDAARAAGDPVAAADCSIAAHIKGKLGEPTMELNASD
jgi:flagellar basal body-associated protein FliL